MDRRYWIWLAECCGPVSLLPQLLVEHFGSPETVFSATDKELEKSHLLNAKQIKQLRAASLRRAEQILKTCEEQGLDCMTWEDARYPGSLREVYAAPLVLYAQGRWPDFDSRMSVGVVGTRYPTEGGASMTRQFSGELAEAGAIVVSGLAIGIDAAAHWGALQGKGTTVAVLSCGVDIDYPLENTDLKQQILLDGGAVCSELAPGTPTNEQTKVYIPQRNRLIAGLSDCVLVGEAPLKSGVSHTVNHALEQGKEVFCLPPRDIYDPHFAGNLQYLQDGATPVYRVQNLLTAYLTQYADSLDRDKVTGKVPMTVRQEEAAPFAGQPKPNAAASTADQVEFHALPALHQQIIRALFTETMQVDDLAVKIGLPPFQLFCELTELEVTGWIESLAGNRYRRCRAERREL